ncbi:excalibur calcium-binding domain-containing protein [Thiomicrorhabdus lithotrophica]|uniref:Excalibur calcium-binding domain-containing protein n=1 Tax=Thiomicrorhabdus lithotrophica TaxID=2949997 RepID=A0ABY8C7C5_9GAMM|nr:excalibur calcium-binding domain-containing protein [Thiomicrorhabdus lithotrophica]WEJ61868.1 excalibur calcium-binding domain-containing protein [Thiomicrorhabdus lithotrophica]
MKTIILLLVITISTWGYFKKSNSAAVHTEVSENPYKMAYECDGREYCSQMTSYEEAKFFTENCPNTKMDGDNDGKPCESQFNAY